MHQGQTVMDSNQEMIKLVRATNGISKTVP